MAQRIKIGDILEIKTKRGLCYAQYTHKYDKSPNYGSLIRVLPDFFEVRPQSFSSLSALKEKFVTFFPLQAAVKENFVTIVANEPVPETSKTFPLFRAGTPDKDTKKVKAWWLWDGEKEWQVGDITTEQRKLPIRGVWNHTLLVERIESGWLPENDNL